MSERYYVMYLKTFAGESMEDRVRGHIFRELGKPRTLHMAVESGSWFDTNLPVSIVTVVE